MLSVICKMWKGDRAHKNVQKLCSIDYYNMQCLFVGKRVNTGESTYKIQAFYDDCEVTGRRYASLQHKVSSRQK